MKLLPFVLSLALFGFGFGAGYPAFAAQTQNPTLRCAVTLLQPVPWAPTHYLVMPETGAYTFEYDLTTEKTVRLNVVSALPTVDPELPQYTFEEATTEDAPSLSIEFSKTGPDGRQFEGTQYGYYLRTPTSGQNPTWALGGQRGIANTTEVRITQDSVGYGVVMCRD